MIRFVFCLLLLWSPAAIAQEEFSLFGPQEQHVELGIEFDQTGASSGESVTGNVIIDIGESWHINSVTPNEEYLIPTRLTLRSDALADVVTTFPAHQERTFGFSEDTPLAVYEGVFAVPFSATRTSAEDETVHVELYYQACDDSICLPPNTVTITASLGTSSGVSPSAVESPAGSFSAVESLAAGDPSQDFTPLSEAPKDFEGNVFSSEVGDVFESRGILLSLLVVFILGLALNLTPCVYPLIPITIGYFSSQNRDRRGTALLSIVYVLGIAITYSLLGVVSAMSGALFGGWLQSTAVLVFFAILMLVLASSMFGMWDMKVPQFISARAGGRAGYAGALVMGLLAGVVAAPCVGPFVASLLAFVARKGDPVLGFVLFFVLALGMGLPYLVLGFSTSSANSLPRSGAWLVVTKKALGFVLIGMAFYFLRPVLGDEIYKIGIGATALVGGFWLLFRKTETRQERVVGSVLAIAILAAGAWLAWPTSHDQEIEWTPYSATMIAEAAEEGRPVIIDFYADWCIPCKELDARTFVDPEVVEDSERFVRLKADLTNGSDESSMDLINEYSILGVPTIVFIDGSGNELPDSRLIGFEKPDRFLQRMKSVE